MRDYWAQRAYTKFGTAIAFATAVLVPAGVVAAMSVFTWNWFAFVVSLSVGALCGFLTKVLSELARVIVEMLLPVANEG